MLREALLYLFPHVSILFITLSIFFDTYVYGASLIAITYYENLFFLSKEEIGLFIALYPIALVFSPPFIGILSHRIGKKPLLLLGDGLLLIGIYLLVEAASWERILLGRLLHGFSGAILWTVGLSSFSSYIQKGRWGISFNSLLASSTGFLLGSFQGGLLFSKGSLPALFSDAGVGVIASFFGKLLFIEEERIPLEKKEPISLRLYFSMPLYIEVLIYSFSTGFLISYLDTFLPIYLSVDLNWDKVLIGSAIGTFAAGKILSYPITHKFFFSLTKKLWFRGIRKTSFVLMIFSISSLVFFSSQKIYLFLLLFLVGMSYGNFLVYSLLEIYSLSDFHQLSPSVAIGFWNTAFSLGMLLGAFIGGFLWEHIGIKGATLTIGAFLILMGFAGGYLPYLWEEHKKL